MHVLEFKIRGKPWQCQAIDEAIRTTQFVRNKCLRYWMDNKGVNKYDLNKHCRVFAQEYPFAQKLNSQARQSAAERAWAAIARFFENAKKGIPGKKFCIDIEVKLNSQPTGKAMELEVGLKEFYTDSNDRSEPNPRFYNESEQRLNLNQCLAKPINDAGWYRSRKCLEYFGQKLGKVTIAVDPAFTSQQCFSCGTKVQKSYPLAPTFALVEVKWIGIGMLQSIF